MSRISVLVAVVLAAIIASPSIAAECLGGRTENWVNIEVCDDNSYCQSICIARGAWDNGDGVETAAAFIHAISQRRVPIRDILKDANQWTDRGKWKQLSPVVVWVEFCREGMPGSSIGNICQ